MKFTKKFDLYCWACDFSPNRGEGILARNYIVNLAIKHKKKILIKSPDGLYYINNGVVKVISKNNYNLKKLNLNFFENYFYPFMGIFYLWFNFFKRNGLCYLNFLPLWNTFLFILLPPKTHLGPITGFIFKKKVININSFLRRYISLLLFKFNLKFLYFRQNQVLFSTDLLKPLIPKKNLGISIFNYQLNMINPKKKIKKKNINILVYNRNYSVKNNKIRNNFLDLLIKEKFKIFVIGDLLKKNKLNNLGYISRSKTIKLLSKTKYIINSGENPYNIFTIDAFNNHVNIIYDRTDHKKVEFFNKNKIFFIDLKKIRTIPNFLKKEINYKYKKSILSKNYKNLRKKYLIYLNKVKIYYTNN